VDVQIMDDVEPYEIARVVDSDDDHPCWRVDKE
jgi:hypothetical protein